MKDYQLSQNNFDAFFDEIAKELSEKSLLIVTTQSAKTGKWGMARLWRAWMNTTADFMASNGCTMPLMLGENGKHYGSRPFNKDDCHELFTNQWLGVDGEGNRLSWARKDHDGMRAATKGERWLAMYKHDEWCLNRGIKIFKPKDSEYAELENEQNK